MIAFENTITVERPIDEVFAFLTHFENVPKWNYYVLSVTRTSPGPVDVGTTYHQVRKSDAQDFRIVTYEPSEKVVIKTIPPSTPAFEMTFLLDPVGKGTRITDRWKLDTGRSALLERLGAGRIRSAVRDNLDKLKTLLETGQVELQDGRRVSLET